MQASKDNGPARVSESVSVAISTGAAVTERSLFTCTKTLGEGAFGAVFECMHNATGRRFAMKQETRESGPSLLGVEARMYRILAGGLGTPRCVFYGRERGQTILVMDPLGPSLEKLFSRCKRKLSIKSVCMVAEQVLDRIEYVHSRGIVHRDIKPDNFLIGSEDRIYFIYLIDFGLAKRIMNPHTGEHIPCRGDKSLLGTPRYASINNHMGKGMSPIAFIFASQRARRTIAPGRLGKHRLHAHLLFEGNASVAGRRGRHSQ